MSREFDTASSNRLLGDFVKHHAARRHFGLELFLQVPGNGFSLAVFVCCEEEVGRALERFLQVTNDVFLRDLVGEA